MNIKWTTIAGFGPRAWNHEEQSMRVPLHHMEKHSEEPKEVTPPQAKKQDSDSSSAESTHKPESVG